MFAYLRGISIAFDVRGEGVPLLLMPAFPLDRSMFRPLPGARLITFDAPGLGDSGLPLDPLRMDDIAGIEAALLDHLGIESAVVGGVSMGGYTAFRFAARFASRLLGLVICDARAEGDTDEGRRSRLDLAETARREGSAEIARRMLPRLLSETTRRENPELVEQVRAKIERNPAEGIARLLEALAHRPNSVDVLGRINVPALVVVGAEDPISTESECRDMAARIPGAHLAVIPQAGHLPNLEQPEQFDAVVGEFLQGLARRPPA